MIEVYAPAKLTWFLEVTGRRDDGMHEIRSEMTTLDFADRLLIETDADYVRLRGASEGIPSDERNVVVRALRMLGQRAGVTIEKRIPTGGGLGGGSADAAAILRFFGGVSDERALELGGDVPFCQRGGRALVEGVGERVSPLDFETRHVTLVMPDFSIDTGACYRAYDELERTGENSRGQNHLEAAAIRVEPRLGVSLSWLRANVGEDVYLAGSGSTMFLPRHVRDDANVWHVSGPGGTLRFRQCTTTPE